MHHGHDCHDQKLVFDDASMVRYRAFYTFQASACMDWLVEYSKGQAMFIPVEVSIHDQARMIVRDLMVTWEYGVIVRVSLAW